MQKIEIPFVGEDYPSPTIPLSSQRTVNWIPRAAQRPSLSTVYLDDPSGVVSFGTTDSEGNRGSHVMAGVPYFVAGNKPVKVPVVVAVVVVPLIIEV